MSSRELVISSCNLENNLTQEPLSSLERSLQHLSSKSLTIFTYHLEKNLRLGSRKCFCVIAKWNYLCLSRCLGLLSLFIPYIFIGSFSSLLSSVYPFVAGFIVLPQVSFLILAG